MLLLLAHGSDVAHRGWPHMRIQGRALGYGNGEA